MKHRKIAIILSALLLTGCGDAAANSEPASTTTAVSVQTDATDTAETTAAEVSGADTTAATTAKATETAVSTTNGTSGTESGTTVSTEAAAGTTAVGIQPALTDSDTAEIKRIASAFMDALMSKDYEKLYDTTNMDQLAKLMALSDPDGKQYTKKEMIDQVFGRLDSEDATVKVTSYEITGMEDGDLELYNSLAEQLAESKKEAQQDEELKKTIEALEPMLSGFERVVNAKIKMTIPERPEDDDPMALPLLRQNGKWTIDVFYGYSASMIKFMLKAQKTAANTNAKSASNAFNTALVEMDSEDIDISFFNDKQLTFKGSDFENLQKPDVKSANIQDILKYKAAQYYDDITKLQEIRVAFSNSCCIAVAVQTEKGKIGVYPIPDGGKTYTDLATALKEAMEKQKSGR